MTENCILHIFLLQNWNVSVPYKDNDTVGGVTCTVRLNWIVAWTQFSVSDKLTINDVICAIGFLDTSVITYLTDLKSGEQITILLLKSSSSAIKYY